MHPAVAKISCAAAETMPSANTTVESRQPNWKETCQAMGAISGLISAKGARVAVVASQRLHVPQLSMEPCNTSARQANTMTSIK